jgi:hypothetical protein
MGSLCRYVVNRGVFTAAHDLARKLRRYTRAYEKISTPFPLDLFPPATSNQSERNRRDNSLVKRARLQWLRLISIAE